MQRMVIMSIACSALLLSSCASTSRYAEEVDYAGRRVIPNDGPRVQMPLSIPSPGRYDVVLCYFITDSGAGYDELARVTGTATVTFHGAVIQQSTLPRRGSGSDLFT